MRITILSFLLLLATNAVAQGDVRSVDFKNFTYKPFCVGDEPQDVTVKDGEFSSEKQEEGYVDRFYYNVYSVAFGDLDKDGKEEAVILGVCNTGGTGNFSEGFVYKMTSGKPLLVARLPGGDRAYGGLRSAKVAGGLIVVERNDVGEQGGACCPEFILTEKYRLAGDKLIEIGKATKRPVVPKERITFARGMSGKTFTTTLEAGDAKQFIVGARAGQTLTVSIDTDQASLRLLDDAEVTAGINNFSVKLPRNGDYTFAVESNATSSLRITVNVKIR